ncbi:MAG: hypothetical protein CO140_02240 [Candidatus Moranbacteria bacterium CG_4_9_14_3_um_filter_40_7]|nr:MAG: hypothetical protein CO140_02240 [Candidatus Moranbacteria bacterium CG_4_9_14_3_um_filter_40_7]
MKKINQNRIKKTLGIILMILVLIFTFSADVSASSMTEITKEEVINLVNQSRKTEGLDILTENEKLNLAAGQKAEDMIKENYFAHNSPGGKTPWFWMEKNNYDYHYAGENLAMDFHNAFDQHLAWMKSPTHRKNILNQEFREIGVAVKQGVIEGHLAIITVQEFGTPMNFVPDFSVKNTPAPQVQALEKQADTNLKTAPIIDKNQPNSSLLKEKFPLVNWRDLAFLYLNALILLIILVVNPFIIAFSVVQFINFKAENEKKLALKN